jgi:hypothetical protein
VKKYYCYYYKDNKPIAGTYVDANNEHDAEINAVFKIECWFPNVDYEEVKVVECFT